MTEKIEKMMSQMTDEEIRKWYEENIAKIFNPEFGTPKISVTVERE